MKQKLNNSMLMSQTPILNSSLGYSSPTKCMIDFDLQVNRPDMPRLDAHENRFEPFQRDPLIYTNTRKSPKIYFDQQISRNEKAYQAQMSDPLFELKHMDLVKARTKGILHFSKM